MQNDVVWITLLSTDHRRHLNRRVSGRQRNAIQSQPRCVGCEVPDRSNITNSQHHLGFTNRFPVDNFGFEVGRMVDMNQPLARLAFYLLEPRSDDGLANWNFLDEAIAGSDVYPILRVPTR